MANNISTQFIDTLDKVYNQITLATLAHANKCFIDYLAVTLSGSRSIKPELYELAKSHPGSSFVFGVNIRTESTYAITLNAYAAHVLELDDGHRAGMMHLAAPVFSALLPVAEKQGSSYEVFLRAAVIGYEAAIRLAKTIQPEHKKKGFHCTGTCGTVGSAMSIAYLLGYSTEEKLNTLSAACTSAAGLLEVIMGQSQQKPYNISHAALAGFTAATLGRMLSSPEDILGGKRGFLSNFSDNPKLEKLLSDGTPEILGGYFKPYAACRHCHAPIEAALKLRENGVSPEMVKQVKVATYDLAVFGHDHKDVDSINSAKMSTPFGVAIALLHGKAGMEMYNNNYIHDDEITSMMERIVVVEDAELSALVPNKRAASIDILDTSDIHHTFRVDYALGEPENPVSLDALFEKFDSLLLSTGFEITYVTELQSFLCTLEYNTTINELITKF